VGSAQRELKHVTAAFATATELLFLAQPKFKISKSTEFSDIETIVTALYRYLRVQMPLVSTPASETRSEFCLGGSIAATYANRDQNGGSNEIVMVLCPSCDFVKGQSKKGDTCTPHCQLELKDVAVLGSIQEQLTLTKCRLCCYSRQPFCCPPLIPSHCKSASDSRVAKAVEKIDSEEAADVAQPLLHLPLSKVLLTSHRVGSLNAAQKQEVDRELARLVRALEPAAAIASPEQATAATLSVQEREQVASRVLQVYTRLDPSWMENNEVIHNLSLLIGVPESELRQLQKQQEQERQEHKQKQEQHDSEEKEEEEEEPAARRGADLGVL
jgi:hypothetical protein